MCWHDPVLLSLKYTGRRQIQWKEANTVEGGKYTGRREIHWKDSNTVEGGEYRGRRQIQWKKGVVLARPWTRAGWSVTQQGTGGQPTPNAVCTQHNGRPIALNYVQTVPTITSQCTALYVCIDERLWHSANTVSTQWKGRPIAQNNVQTVHITTEPGTKEYNTMHCIVCMYWRASMAQC